VLNKRKDKRAALTRPLPPASAEFVERMGCIMETDGHSRIAGRMIGLLLLSEGYTSLDEVADKLNVSKPSVSINARHLEEVGVLERVGRAGDRRDYYRITDDLIGRTMEQRLAKLRRLQDVVASARSTAGVSSRSVLARLEDFTSACEHIGRVTEAALTEWRNQAAKEKSSGVSDATRTPRRKVSGRRSHAGVR
jgi:DNA-binding transcriptional regulator GbsR (MarR family)